MPDERPSERRGAAHASPLLIELRGVGVRIGDRKVLEDVSVSAAPGETLVLLGRSGSGKTTTLKLVNRLIEPSAGEVIVEGRSTTSWDPIELRRRIGYVIQEAGLFPHWTVAGNVATVPRLLGWDHARIAARVDELLDLVGLDPATFAGRYPRQLSGGQRQRVGVARALAADPPLLLMDEPFGALDPLTRLELQRELGALTARLGKTVLFVTHDVREALALATRIVLFDAGRVCLDAAPEDFLASPLREVQAFVATGLGRPERAGARA